MNLNDILRPELFWPKLTAKSKAEVIRELAANLAKNIKNLNSSMITDILLERECLGSTGIQDGIAIPHGKVPGLEKIVVACGHSPEGIDFESHDQKPTRLFFVLLAPEFAAGQHLKILARLSKLLKDQRFRERLMAASDGEEMYNCMIEEDKRI